MTRLSVFVATSVDGYLAAEDGSLDWLDAAVGPDEDYGYDTFIADVDALAMGRRTYDFIAHLDPLPFAGRPVFVFTHHRPAQRSGVTFWNLSPRAALARWEADGLQHVYVDGGQVISDFLAEGLIDDLVLSTAPVLLGRGRPLFHPGGAATALRLESVQSWPSGFVSSTYRRPS